MPSDPREGIFKRGFVVDLPGGEAERLARELAALGFLALEEKQYVRCVNPLDHDRQFARDLGCTGRIYLSDRDEDDHEYRCPSCERAVFPSRKKQAGTVRLSPNVERMVAFVRDEIAKAGVEAEEKPRGLFRISIATGEVQVCLVDLCMDPAIFAETYPYRRSVIFIVGNERDYARRVPESAVQFRLTDLVLGEATARFRREVRRLAGLEGATPAPALPAVLTMGLPLPTIAVAPAPTNAYPGVVRIAAAPRTPWSKVELFYEDGETIAIRVPGQKLKRYSFADLGMATVRGRKPTKAWRIILAICHAPNNCVDWRLLKSIIKSFEAFKEQVSSLRPLLQHVFGIDENPFVRCSRTEGLQSAFRAFPELPGNDPYVGEKEWSKEGARQI